MRYLADILTSLRLILAIVLFVLALTGGSPEAALIIFIIAEFTDIFDGTCARKWPFPKNKTPKYRKYAVKYDMIADISLTGALVLFLTLQVNWVSGLAFIVYYLISSLGGELLVYGRILGHPDDCTDNSMAKRNFPLAKKIILTRRYIFAICLCAISVFILFATNWPDTVKYALLGLGCLIIIFVWFFLRQRRHNISRDAIDIENKLTKSHH